MAKLLVGKVKTGATKELIDLAVKSYLVANPVVADEPLLREHLADPTPHPVYDNLAAGRFVSYLRNGMA